MSDPSRLEIEALAKIMDELDYYHLLNVERDVSTRDLKLAYYKNSRIYHPDANRNLDAALQERCHEISKCLPCGVVPVRLSASFFACAARAAAS